MKGPLRHRGFRLLLAGRAISMVGTSIAPVAIAFAVLDLTGSAADLGIVLAARSIPQVAFMLVGGLIADRFDRGRVLVAANVVASGMQAGAAGLVLTGAATVPALAALEAVNGAASAIVFPAAAAMTPQVVPAAVLQQANALLRLGLNTAMIVGTSCGGLLVGTVGSGWGLAVDAAAYLVAAACFAARAAERVHHRPEPRRALAGVVADLREGWHEVARHTWLWSVVVAFGFANAAHAAGWHTLGPVVADGSFGPEGWGLVLAAQTAGMLAGALLLLRVRPQRPLFVGCAAILLWVPMLVVLAVDPRLPVLLPVAVIAGLGLEAFGIFWDLSLQQNVPLDRLSRVYSFDALGSYAMIPLGQLVAGPMAAALGVRHAVLTSATVIGLSIVATLMVPSVRHLRRTDTAAVAAVAGR